MPGIANGNVIKSKVTQFLAPKFLAPSSKDTSLILKAATIGHTAYVKSENMCTAASPGGEELLNKSLSPPNWLYIIVTHPVLPNINVIASEAINVGITSGIIHKAEIIFLNGIFVLAMP